MDRLVYVSMSGAGSSMTGQVHNANNLANAATPGFRADLITMTSSASGSDSRAYSKMGAAGIDVRPGRIEVTGNKLDVAINGDGWLVVQAPEGGEAITRRGDLRIDVQGRLINGAGHQIMGENGPVAIPPHSTLDIAADGTISIVPLGEDPNAATAIERLKLVNVEADQIQKGLDGLLRLKNDGQELVSDASVMIQSGALEGSNVNPVESMVRMIEMSRGFDTQTKLMRMASDNDRASSELMKIA